MKHLPLFLDVKEAPCLVIGGGQIAARKCSSLINAGASVTVLAPELCAALREQLDAGEIQHLPLSYPCEEFGRLLQNSLLVLAATSDSVVNQAIATDAKNTGTLSNIADAPDSGSFVLPSIINRDPMLIAISSSGTSPVLTRLLRKRLEAFIPQGYSTLATLAGEYRDEIKRRFSTLSGRRRFWETTLNGPMSELMLSGNETEARSAFKQTLESESDNTLAKGEVYLVGAGPGNPDLLTFRALRLIQQAEVVLYDRLVSPDILSLCRSDVEKIYVGKKRSEHTMQQEAINETLVRLALAGKRVLRLKGGDPFIFGRGGEEIEELAEHGIPFQVVPGITAASGCASYAGIPLTHRDHAQSCVFVTGHLKDGTLDLPWQQLAQPAQTVVCYMGLLGLPVICSQLIKHGMPESTPAALIERGTTAEQQVHTGTIASLPQLIEEQSVTAPTLIIIGSVVTLRENLSWYR